MQDRYLFRAKRKDDGEWVFGGLSYCEKTGAYFITNMGKDHISYIGFHQEVDPNTICQSTGLKDKNGNLIWENDIVKDNVIYGVVKWDDDNAMYIIDDRDDGYQVYSDWWHEVEVIGNIFDDLELLED